MCGICACVSKPRNIENSTDIEGFTFKELKSYLQRRGPNHLQEIASTYKKHFDLFFCSTVLHLRGSTITKQPVTDQKGNFYLWNGEIFGGPLLESVSESDTETLAEKLFSSSHVSEILEILSSIEGPYAFIFYQDNGLLWFGRDVFGRRSLLWNFENSTFQLCSVASGNAEWEEVPTVGIFCLDLYQSQAQKTFVIYQYSWSSTASGGNLRQEAVFNSFNVTDKKIASDFKVKVPVTKKLNTSMPSDTASSNFLHELDEFWNSKLTHQELFQKILSVPVLIETVNKFENCLSDAVKKRAENQLGLCKICYLKMTSVYPRVICDHASVGVLFSGGLDSIVIACLVDRHLPKDRPIDLINVAFGRAVDVQNNKKQKQCQPFDTPDRITGKNGLKELRNISPSRKWNFIEVNVSKEELASKRKEIIRNLLNPSYSVLDDSIGCAVWFAAQGKGLVSILGEYHAYDSPARVLLVGMGADEQLAGYSRHRAKFNASGWSGLIEELALELDRIGSRNLGRDDRIIADAGVESRYPFLDENVVSFLNSLPVWLKANLNFPRGIGEKLLLRLLAFKLGLSEAAVLPKRAIQFGSRIAKIENTKEKGSDVCDRLTALKC